jgi:hypothetical protein
MAEFLAGSYAFDLVLLLLVLDTLGLTVPWCLRACDLPPRALLVTPAPRGCLLLAVRAAVVDALRVRVALFLTASPAVHLTDSRLRWRPERCVPIT